jgi:nicotinic acid mononucleotide adenylyltransferase
MEFLWRGARPGAARIALLAGAFNPPTRAHMALARAALDYAPEVVFVLPRAFPHKPWEGTDPARRLEWLVKLCHSAGGLSAAAADGGLFLEIARECRQATRAGRVLLACGRDTAERIVGWDYADGPSIEDQLEEYELLVAPRQGFYVPPPALAEKVHALRLAGDYDEASSTAVREAIVAGRHWGHLVPDEIAREVAAAYSPR